MVEELPCEVVFLIFGKPDEEDYITSNIEEGLAKNGRSYVKYYFPYMLDAVNWARLERCRYIFIIAYRPHFPPAPDSLEFSPMKILDEINKWDKCVYFDATEWRFDHKPPWELADGSTGSRLEPFNFTYMKEKCKAYFKRECYVRDFKEGYWPFPYSFSQEKKGLVAVAPGLKKIYDIFCSFPQTYTGLRMACLEFCAQLRARPEFNVNTRIYEDRQEYVRTIAESYITMDSMGAGHCNTRFFEAVPNFTAVFRQKYEVVIPYDFDHSGDKERDMIVEYESEEDMKRKVLRSFLDPDHLIGMGYRARDHALSYHTCEARVRYLFDVLEGRVEEKAFSENPLLRS